MSDVGSRFTYRISRNDESVSKVKVLFEIPEHALVRCILAYFQFLDGMFFLSNQERNSTLSPYLIQFSPGLVGSNFVS